MHAREPASLGSLSNNVLERRTSTGSGLFASLGSGLVETLRSIVFIRETKFSNTNLFASRHIKRDKASLPVDVRCSKTSSLKVPILEGKRGGRRHSTTSFSENVEVAETRYQM